MIMGQKKQNSKLRRVKRSLDPYHKVWIIVTIGVWQISLSEIETNLGK